MLGKRDIEKLRLKTRLSECKMVIESTVYPSQKEAAKKQLDLLQEEFKAISGEYATEYLLKEVNEMYGPYKHIFSEILDVCNRYSTKLTTDDIITVLTEAISTFEKKK